MATLKDLRSFYDPALKLPVGGKTYTISAPNVAEGGRLKAIFNNPDATYTDADQLAEIAKLLGAEWVPNIVDSVAIDPITEKPIIGDDGQPVTIKIDQGCYAGGVWSELEADGVSWPELVHVGTTALIHFGQGAMLGEVFWEVGHGGIEGSTLPEPPKAPAKKAAPRPRSSKPAVRKAAKKAAPKKAA